MDKIIFAVLSLVFSLPSGLGLLRAEEIKHRFYALDESRSKIHYVDQFDPSNDWTIDVAAGSRDMQLVNGKIVIGLFSGGFRDYDPSTRKTVRETVDPKYKAGSVTACRLDDGRTILASDVSPIRISVLDTEGKELSSVVFSNVKTVRCVRMTPRGTILFGGNDNHVYEATLDGKVIRDIEIPGAKHNYMVRELPNGHLMVATGYGGFLAELDGEGKIVKKWGGKPGPDGVNIHFFADFQMLKNGHVVVANWTGHGANDSEKAPQILEFDPEGRLVWRWHDAQTAGSIHNIVVVE